MVKVIQEKNLKRIGKEPVVVFPLEKWEEIRELLEEQEEAVRFMRTFSDPRNKKLIPFEKVKKQFKLP